MANGILLMHVCQRSKTLTCTLLSQNKLTMDERSMSHFVTRTSNIQLGFMVDDSRDIPRAFIAPQLVTALRMKI